MRLKEDLDMTSIFLDYIKTYNPKFEPRKEQLELMDSIDSLLQSTEHNALIAEAATGTGKTLGALLPVLKSGAKRVFYCTPNVMLINSLLSKDIPRLKETLFPDLTAIGLIGKDRFVCLNKINDQYPNQKSLKDDALNGDWNQIRDTYQGKIEISDELWNDIKYRGDQCRIESCPYADKCAYVKMRKAAQSSQLVVTTYAMLFALLDSDSELIGNIEDAVFIFDEAHQLPELITSSLQKSFQLSRICKCFEADTFDEWKTNVLNIYPNYNEIITSLDSSIDKLIDSIYDFEQSLSIRLSEQSDDLYQSNSISLSLRLDKHPEPKAELADLYGDIHELYEFFNEVQEVFKEDNANGSHSKLMDKVSYYIYLLEQAVGVHELSKKGDYKPVDWTALDTREFASLVTYEAAPMRLEPFFDQFKTAKSIFMSGTLVALGKLDFFMKQMGLHNDEVWQPIKVILKSPFDLNNQGTLIVDDSIGSPSDDDYIAKFANTLPELLSDTQAGLILLNSYNQVNKLEEEMRWNDDLKGISFKFQGDDSRERLLDAHKADIEGGQKSVLIGLSSFGTGLDLPAELLDTVIIGALPFKAVNDPINSAKAEQVEKSGKNSFYHYTLPIASNTLTQYCGRLIRTSECRGKIIITDNRIVTKKYGSSLLSHLPDFAGKSKCVVANKALSGSRRRNRKPSQETMPTELPKEIVF